MFGKSKTNSIQHLLSRVARIFNCCQNVIALEIGIILQDLLVKRPGAEQIQSVCNAKSHASNAAVAATFPRLNRDSFQRVNLRHRLHLATQRGAWQPRNSPAAAGHRLGRGRLDGFPAQCHAGSYVAAGWPGWLLPPRWAVTRRRLVNETLQSYQTRRQDFHWRQAVLLTPPSVTSPEKQSSGFPFLHR